MLILGVKRMIKVTYQQAEAMCQDLTIQNSIFKRQIENLVNYEAELHGMWQGDASRIFHQNFQYGVERMRVFSEVIEAYVMTLKIIVANYKKADQYKGSGISVDTGKTFKFPGQVRDEYIDNIEIPGILGKEQELVSGDVYRPTIPIHEIKESETTVYIKDIYSEFQELQISKQDGLEMVLNKILKYWFSSELGQAVLAPIEMGNAILIQSKEQHYNRNANNVIPDDINEIFTLDETESDKIVGKNGWRVLPERESIYHRNIHGTQGKEAMYNYKFVHDNPDGTSSEAIICIPPNGESSPYLVDDPYNAGTFNYASPNPANPKSYLEHLVQDVFPYWLWGNQEVDSGADNAIFRVTGHDNISDLFGV